MFRPADVSEPFPKPVIITEANAREEFEAYTISS